MTIYAKTIAAIADTITAAGFTGLANQFLNYPSDRAAVLRDGWLRREIVRRVGEQQALRFFALATLTIERADRT